MRRSNYQTLSNRNIINAYDIISVCHPRRRLKTFHGMSTAFQCRILSNGDSRCPFCTSGYAINAAKSSTYQTRRKNTTGDIYCNTRMLNVLLLVPHLKPLCGNIIAWLRSKYYSILDIMVKTRSMPATWSAWQLWKLCTRGLVGCCNKYLQ